MGGSASGASGSQRRTARTGPVPADFDITDEPAERQVAKLGLRAPANNISNIKRAKPTDGRSVGRNTKPFEGQAEYEALGIRGKIANDIAMGLGFKERDESYRARTAVTAERQRKELARAARQDSTDDVADAQSRARTTAATAAPVAAATTNVTPMPPDPDTMETGEAETALNARGQTGRAATIITTPQGLLTEGAKRPKRSLMGGLLS